MNSFLLKKSLKHLTKNFYASQLMRFGAKKTTKPTSGSDVEADKSKKVIRGSPSDGENTNTTETLSTSTSQTNTQTSNETNKPKVLRVDSVPNNKPPFSEETVAGRYAQTLFMGGSQAKELYHVYNDMIYLNQLYETSSTFKTFTDNSGLNVSQLNSFSESIKECADFSKTTMSFLDLLARNKRYMYINEIAKKFIRAYHMLSKEEKITIISATELNSEERQRIKEALLANPENEGKTFIIDYTINSSIIGGLQMYSENKFMDLSLTSRLDKLKDEVNKLL